MRRLSGLVLVVAVLVAACGGGGGTSPPPTNPPDVLPGTTAPPAVTGPPPWPAPVLGVSALAQAAGLTMLPREAFNEHIHAHLDVFYDGQPVTVPAYVGIDLQGQAISPLHTHDTSGIVHIESPTVKPFTLGQFFGEWDVQMGNGCVAGQCPPARPVALYDNGAKVVTAPQDLVFAKHDEIVLVIGSAPPTIPSSYPFPAGY